MKKLISLALAAVMALSLVACGSGNKGKDTGDKTYKVGVVQLVQHEALDAATKGFTDALKEALGDKVEVVEKNASGDSNNCTTIVNGFISDKVDLIMANATPALQAAASATSTIPILGTSVTDYRSGNRRLDRHRGRQHLRHLRPGSPGQAGRHAPGAVPQRQEGGYALLLQRAQQQIPG